MMSTLKAIVQGGRIEWQEATENIVPLDQPIDVLVTILGGASGWAFPGGAGSPQGCCAAKACGAERIFCHRQPGPLAAGNAH
jgi:hypothetical protein